MRIMEKVIDEVMAAKKWTLLCGAGDASLVQTVVRLLEASSFEEGVEAFEAARQPLQSWHS
jgi:hypothetical protein